MNTRQPSTTGGLSLPTNVGMGQTAEQQVHAQWDTVGQVEAELAMRGFMPMDTPNYPCPVITEEALTTSDSKSYTTTYAQQLSWFNYSSQTLSRIVADLLGVQNEMTLIEARMRKGFRLNGAKMTAQQMADEILLDPRYLELKHREQLLSQHKIELSAYTEGIERGLKVISRQVEIRKQEIEQNRVNIPGRGYGVRGTGG